MKTTIAMLLVASAAIATGAGAQTYDVVADFGNPVFSYGVGSGLSFTSLPLQSSCFGNASLSCYAANPNTPPTIVKNNGTTAQNFGTPTIPTDMLLLHPGPQTTNSDALLRFTSSTGGIYDLSGAFSRLDTSSRSGNGVNVSIYSVTSGIAAPIFFGFIGNSNYAADPFSSRVTLTPGSEIVFAVNNAGEYTYDSTGLRASISAVPEPATWAMMLVGFGMIGLGLRYRRKSTNVSFG